MKKRCDWSGKAPLYVAYHDEEWGDPFLNAHMQAVGMVNDHLVGCFRHREVARLGRTGRSKRQEGVR